jgi:hypothetical protein
VNLLLQAFQRQVRLSSALLAVDCDVLLVAVDGAGVLLLDELLPALSSLLVDDISVTWSRSRGGLEILVRSGGFVFPLAVAG